MRLLENYLIYYKDHFEIIRSKKLNFQDNAARRVCSGILKGEHLSPDADRKCLFLHNDDPFFKLGKASLELEYICMNVD